MTREFSLAHFTLLDCPPPEFVRIAATAGYDFAGLRLIPVDRPGEPRYVLAENRALRRETAYAFADTGIRLLDIEVAQISESFDARACLPALDAAADLGARSLLATVWTPDRNRAIDGFSTLCELAQPFDMTVMLEFISFADLATLGQAVDVVRASGCSNVGILVDTLHCHLAHTSLDDLATLPAKWLPYAHLCDAPAGIPPTRDARRRIAREGRLLPGEGAIDVAGIVSRLPPASILSIEAPNPARAKAVGAQQYAVNCLAAAKRCLAASTVP
jgi:sugar phosphate isomerase/epimerase